MFQLQQKTKDLIRLFVEADYGTEFTYAQILAETECDVMEKERHRIYTAVGVLEREHRKTLVNLRGRGYKVALPGEHAQEMLGRKRRVRKQVGLATRTGKATPLERLNDSELRSFADAQVAIGRLAQAVDHHDRRIARLEQHVGITEETPIDGTAEEISGEAA